MTTMPSRPKNRTRMALAVLAATGIAGWFSVGNVESSAGVSSSGETSASLVLGPGVLMDSSPHANTLDVLRVPRTITSRLERELLLAATPGGKNFSGEKLEELCMEPFDTSFGTPAAFLYASKWGQADPEGMYAWFRDQGQLNFALRASNVVGMFSFTKGLFTAWAERDPDSALAAALQPGTDPIALTEVMGILGKSDPRKAAAFMIEHPERMNGNFGLSPGGKDFQENWDFLRSLPAGEGRGKMLASYFTGMSWSKRAEAPGIWKTLPEDARRELVEGGFQGIQEERFVDGVLQHPIYFDGLDEMLREKIAASRDPEVVRNYLNTGGLKWAETDPAAAIAWVRENLSGEAQVTGAAKMFRAGAAKKFDATMAVWQSLPDGGLRARAAGKLAAGAPADRKSEAEAVLSALSPAEQAIARQAMGTSQ